jgi:hypothetical protein
MRDRFVMVRGLIARERVSINKAVDDLSSIDKDHQFTVSEEKLDYPAKLEESVRKKAVKAAISEIGILQRQFKAHLRKKYLSEEETPSSSLFIHKESGLSERGRFFYDASPVCSQV